MDFIDVVVTTNNTKKRLEDYDFDNGEYTVRLVSYIRWDVPIQNEAEL